MKLILMLYLFNSCASSPEKLGTDLVQSNNWFIDGPTVENTSTINALRKKNNCIKVTANNTPSGEIELHVMITPTLSGAHNGAATKLSKSSNFVQITYSASHPIVLQARQGNTKGDDCIHGGSHPQTNIPASPNKFTTIKISWTKFKQDGKPDGTPLDISNLCKFNFVNYKPVQGASFEISSVILENFKL
ncbi:MAG: hypothetical protein V3U92_15795 [Cellulophaga sp.]